MRFIVINTIFGALLGSFAAVMAVPFAVVLGPILGAPLGLATSPVVGVCVHRKNPTTALSIIYGVTVLVTVVAAPAKFPFFILQMSILALILSSVCVRLFLADAPPMPSSTPDNRCQKCGYNLTGTVSGRCPECGKLLASETDLSEREPPKTRWAALALSLGIVTISLAVISLRKQAEVRPAKDVDGLIQQLANGEALIHEPAINEMVKRGKEPLLLAIKHPNPTVRRHAVKGLGRLKDPTTVPQLVSMLADTDPWARMWAAGALGDFGDSSAICPLLSLRSDPRVFVRQNVERALRSLGVDPAAEGVDLGCGNGSDEDRP